MSSSIPSAIAETGEQDQAGVTPVAYAPLATPYGAIGLYGTDHGLVKVALPNEPRAQAEAFVRRVLGPVRVREGTQAKALLRQALDQLGAYFAGSCRVFTLDLDMRGTAFQRQVWVAVAAVAYGATRSYAQIARDIGRPTAVRAVGAANGANPLPIVIPCHRIVGTDQSLTGYGGGLAMKRGLLALEQVGAGA